MEQILGSHLAEIASQACESKCENTKLLVASIANIKKALEVRNKLTPQEIEASLPLEAHVNSPYFTQDEKNK